MKSSCRFHLAYGKTREIKFHVLQRTMPRTAWGAAMVAVGAPPWPFSGPPTVGWRRPRANTCRIDRGAGLKGQGKQIYAATTSCATGVWIDILEARTDV